MHIFVPLSCACLHALLVAAHLSLLDIWAYGAKHAIVFSPQVASSVQTYTLLVSQIIIVISGYFCIHKADSIDTVKPYTAVLVFLTQYVTLLALLSGQHTLTSLQDTASAWMGLGASGLTLWRQVASPSYAIGVFQVMLYLISVSCLHITTPSLFSVQSFISSVSEPTAGIMGMPVFNAL